MIAIGGALLLSNTEKECDGCDSMEEVDDFINSLTDTHFQKISSFFDTMPVLKHDIHLKCTKKKKDKICSYKETITLSGLQSFFA